MKTRAKVGLKFDFFQPSTYTPTDANTTGF